MKAIKDLLPAHAKDVRVNLGGLERSEHLSEQELWGALLASAFAARNGRLLGAVAREARERLSDEAFGAARAAAETMAMNNVYYRFVHLASNDEYGRLPARLRMQALANPGVDKLDLELWSLAVSAINGCGMCIDSHERALREAGATTEAIQDIVRVAAIVQAAATVLDGDEALASPDRATA